MTAKQSEKADPESRMSFVDYGHDDVIEPGKRIYIVILNLPDGKQEVIGTIICEYQSKTGKTIYTSRDILINKRYPASQSFEEAKQRFIDDQERFLKSFDETERMIEACDDPRIDDAMLNGEHEIPLQKEKSQQKKDSGKSLSAIRADKEKSKTKSINR